MRQATAAFLCPPGFSRPKALALVREAAVVVEAARFAQQLRADRAQVRARPFVSRSPLPRDADPVLLVPGFMAGDYSLRGMARHLRGRGYRTYSSCIRANAGCLAETTDALERRIESVAVKRERKVVLLGHSLGGILARGMAARRPDLVSAVVTMGSPLLAPAAMHRLLVFDVQVLLLLQRAGIAKVMGPDCTSGTCAQQMWEQAQKPLSPEVVLTSIYSRRDGIVDWHACLDPAGRSIEVSTTHCGMAIEPSVFKVVADVLAEIAAAEARTALDVAGSA